MKATWHFWDGEVDDDVTWYHDCNIFFTTFTSKCWNNVIESTNRCSDWIATPGVPGRKENIKIKMQNTTNPFDDDDNDTVIDDSWEWCRGNHSIIIPSIAVYLDDSWRYATLPKYSWRNRWWLNLVSLLPIQYHQWTALLIVRGRHNDESGCQNHASAWQNNTIAFQVLLYDIHPNPLQYLVKHETWSIRSPLVNALPSWIVLAHAKHLYRIRVMLAI